MWRLCFVHSSQDRTSTSPVREDVLVMTSDTGSQPAFQSRVDTVFGALQTATNPDGSAWFLRDEQVAMQTHKFY